MNHQHKTPNMRASFTRAQRDEIRECHPLGKLDCYCDNGHIQNETTCMYCWYLAENDEEQLRARDHLRHTP